MECSIKALSELECETTKKLIGKQPLPYETIALPARTPKFRDEFFFYFDSNREQTV
jgi:hypothetical protein